MTVAELGDLVDLAAYPIDDLDGERARALVARCRAELAGSNSCFLPRFVTLSALRRMQDQARRVATLAWFGGGRVNAYYDEGDPSFPARHPRNVFFDRPVGIVAYDQMAPDSALCRLYLQDELIEFLRRVVDVDELHRVNDRYQPISVMVLKGGQTMGWHFDVSEFTVTMLLQAPEAGGDFEFVHNIRSADDPSYDAIGALYEGDRSRVRVVAPEPGALFVFQGRHSLHHVTEVVGARDRLMAVLTFDTVAGATIDEATNVATYGPRVAMGAVAGRP